MELLFRLSLILCLALTSPALASEGTPGATSWSAPSAVGLSIYDPQGNRVATVIEEDPEPLGKGGLAEVRKVFLRFVNGDTEVVALKLFDSEYLADHPKIAQEMLVSHTGVATLWAHHAPQHLRRERGNLELRIPGQASVKVVVAELTQGSILNFRSRFELPKAEDLPKRINHLHQLLLDTSSGLNELQNATLGHTDIKPGNIHLQVGPNGESRYLLGDLDGMKLYGARWSVWTPGYLPPEGVRNVTPLADIYALAVSIDEMAFGRNPVHRFIRSDSRYENEFYNEASRRARTDSAAVSELNRLRDKHPSWAEETILDELLDQKSFRGIRYKAYESAFGAVVAKPNEYARMLETIRARYDTVIKTLPKDSPEATNLLQIRDFVIRGMAFKPQARLNALENFHYGQPFLQTCAERLALAAHRALNRLFQGIRPVAHP